MTRRPGETLRQWLDRQRMLQTVERHAQASLETFPGTSQGRALPAAPIARDGGGPTVPAVTIRRGGPAGEIIKTSATSDSVASGGDFLTADTEDSRHGFNSNTLGDTYTIPRTATYWLHLNLSWDSYLRGGTFEVQVNGTTVPDGTLDAGGLGDGVEWGVGFDASKDDTVKVKVTQSSGSAQAATFTQTLMVVEPTKAISVSEAAPPQGDLFIWWKADSSLISTGAITSWPNEIGGVGWDLEDDGGVRNGATVVDGVLNGLPVVRLDADLDGFYATGDTFPSGDDFTIYVVWRLRDRVRNDDIMRGTTTKWYLRYVNAIDGYRWWGMDESSAANRHSWRYDSVVDDSTGADTSTWRRDGTIVATNVGHEETVSLSLGYSRETSTTAQASNSDFAEMLVYTAVHTDTERAEVIDYLTTKWGL